MIRTQQEAGGVMFGAYIVGSKIIGYFKFDESNKINAENYYNS